MTAILALGDAVAEFVRDGDEIALEGFTHLIPHAAGHELIRQGRRDLVLIRLTPDIVCDQLIGSGCASGLVFSWAGNPGVGSLWRFRDAVEHQWPRPLLVEEHTHDGMAARYAAGASALPFGLVRSYGGTDLLKHTRNAMPVTSPFSGEEVTAVRALNPDVTVIHAQRADRKGNVQLWGILGVQKEAVLAARKAIVTVEEIVDDLDSRPGAVYLPYWVISAVSLVPHGAHPSYATGYSERDNEFYRAWDSISRDRTTFNTWIGRCIRSTRTHDDYLASALVTAGA